MRRGGEAHEARLPVLSLERASPRTPAPAILAADAAEYSRLVGADQEGTLDRPRALCRELADPKIKEQRGCIVKAAADGLLLGRREPH